MFLIVFIILCTFSPNICGVFLELVVPSGSPTITCLFNEPWYMRLALCLCHVKLKAVTKFGENPISAAEARQVNSWNHRHLYKGNNFFCMLPECEESFDHESLELVEEFAALSSENIDVLLSELEGHRLEIHILAWTVRKHKTEIDMDHVTLRIK